jgi:hypothetical protein
MCLCLKVCAQPFYPLLKLVRHIGTPGVRAQCIVIGMGESLYLDVLSIRTGKRKAMGYVRKMFSTSKERVVAAGDSGGNVLMLEGAHMPISPYAVIQAKNLLLQHQLPTRDTAAPPRDFRSEQAHHAWARCRQTQHLPSGSPLLFPNLIN